MVSLCFLAKRYFCALNYVQPIGVALTLRSISELYLEFKEKSLSTTFALF